MGLSRSGRGGCSARHEGLEISCDLVCCAQRKGRRAMSKPEDRIPSVSDIARLPRWAQVAFAARCARRVQPLFKYFWPDAKVEYATAIRESLDAVEAICIKPRHAAVSTPRRILDRLAIVEDAFAYETSSAQSWLRAKDIVEGVIASVQAAAYALGAFENFADDLYQSEHAASDAVEIASEILEEVATSLDRAIVRDYQLLASSANKLNWTDETPVPPEVFGAMWPEGEPEGWPEEGREPLLGATAYELSVVGPDGVDAKAVRKRTVKLLRLMDRYVRASGGNGVRLEDDAGVTETSPYNAPQPVGGGA